MRKEVKTLTGLRGLTALLVMLYHFFDVDPYLHAYTPSLLHRGYLGVDVFFILSGFVMALSYARNFESQVTVSAYVNFIIKRLARVYPLYIVVTVIFLTKYEVNLSGIWKGDFGLPDLLACVTMTQAWGGDFASVAGATWSLSTEFLAYLLYPLVVSLLVFGSGVYAVSTLGISFGLLCLVSASGLGVSGPLDVVSSSSVLPLLRCLAGFCIGLVMYRLSRAHACRAILSSSGTVIALIAGLGCAVRLGAPDLVLYGFFPLTVLSLSMESSAARRVFANPVVHHLGVISYSLYLAHTLFVSVSVRLEPIVEHRLGGAAHWLILVVVSILSWIVAWLLYRCVEMPGRVYVQRWLLLGVLPQTG